MRALHENYIHYEKGKEDIKYLPEEYRQPPRIGIQVYITVCANPFILSSPHESIISNVPIENAKTLRPM